MLFLNENGYPALLLLFAVVENVCKSIIEDYNLSFYEVVERLETIHFINRVEKNFLSKNDFSIRKIRNLVVHEDLMSIFYVDENEIFYPLYENESCLKLYKQLFEPSLDIIIKLIKAKLKIS